jgi:hypothetical protein
MLTIDTKVPLDATAVAPSLQFPIPAMKPFELFRATCIDELITEMTTMDVKRQQPLVLHLTSPQISGGDGSAIPAYLKYQNQANRFLSINGARQCTSAEYPKLSRRFEQLLYSLSDEPLSAYIPISSTVYRIESGWSIVPPVPAVLCSVQTFLDLSLTRIAVRGSIDRKDSNPPMLQFIEMTADKETPKRCSFSKRRGVHARWINGDEALTAESYELEDIDWKPAREHILYEQIAVLGQAIHDIEFDESHHHHHPFAARLSSLILLRAYLQHILRLLGNEISLASLYGNGGEPYELNADLLMELKQQLGKSSPHYIIINYENDVDFGRVTLSMECLELFGVRWLVDELVHLYPTVQRVIVVMNTLKVHRFEELVKNEEDFTCTGIRPIYQTFTGISDITRDKVKWKDLRSEILMRSTLPRAFRDPLQRSSSSASEQPWIYTTREESQSNDPSKPGRLLIFTATRPRDEKEEQKPLDLAKVFVQTRYRVQKQRQTQAVLKLGIGPAEFDDLEWTQHETGFGPKGGASLERRYPLEGRESDIIATCLSTRLMDCPSVQHADVQRYFRAWTTFAGADMPLLYNRVAIDVLRSQLQYRNARSITNVVEQLLSRENRNNLDLRITDDYLGMVEAAFVDTFGNNHRMIQSRRTNFIFTEPLGYFNEDAFRRLYAECHNQDIKEAKMQKVNDPIERAVFKAKHLPAWCQVIFCNVNWGQRDPDNYGKPDGTYAYDDAKSDDYFHTQVRVQHVTDGPARPTNMTIGPTGRALKAPRPRLKEEKLVNPLIKIRRSIASYFSDRSSIQPREVLMIFCIPVRAHTYSMNLPQLTLQSRQSGPYPVATFTTTLSGKFEVETKDVPPNEVAVPTSRDPQLGIHPHETFMTAYVRTLLNNQQLWGELKSREEQKRMKLFVLTLGPIAVVFIGLRRDANAKSPLFAAMDMQWRLPYHNSLPPREMGEKSMDRLFKLQQERTLEDAKRKHHLSSTLPSITLAPPPPPPSAPSTVSNSPTIVAKVSSVPPEEKKRGPNDFMSNLAPPPSKKGEEVPLPLKPQSGSQASSSRVPAIRQNTAAVSERKEEEDDELDNDKINAILSEGERVRLDGQIDKFFRSGKAYYQFNPKLTSKHRLYIHRRANYLRVIEKKDVYTESANTSDNKRAITIYRGAKQEGGESVAVVRKAAPSSLSLITTIYQQTHLRGLLDGTSPLIKDLPFTMDLTSKIPRIEYKRGNVEQWPLENISIWKTRGAFLREIDFLVTELSQLRYSGGDNDDEKKSAYVLYVDRLPSRYVSHLKSLFQDYCTFEVVSDISDSKEIPDHFDPKKHSAKFLICNPETAAARQTSTRSTTALRNERISAELKEQYRLHTHIKPLKSLLKFDIPYDDYSSTETFLTGKLRLEPWSNFHTTECRIVVEGKTVTTQRLDIKTHEQQMSYFHRVMRPAVYEHKVNTLCHCYDCRAEVDILSRYLQFRDEDEITADLLPGAVSEMSKEITKSLNDYGEHRNLFELSLRPLSASKSFAVSRPKHMKSAESWRK